MTKEKLIEQIMKECEKDGEPVTKEEAVEMAEMELKAKKDCRHYETDATKTRKPAAREKKIDAEKVKIIKSVAEQLTRLVGSEECECEATDIKITNSQREIQFKIDQNDYSLVLTKHRKSTK
jgi:hypothetical protein